MSSIENTFWIFILFIYIVFVIRIFLYFINQVKDMNNRRQPIRRKEIYHYPLFGDSVNYNDLNEIEIDNMNYEKLE
jgi:hypothetical protein